LRVELVKAGPRSIKTKVLSAAPAVGDSTKKLRRNLLKKWIYKTLKNGDIILRSWLLYSKL